MKWFKDINTLADLRNRYKQLLLQFHPDNNPDKDTTAIMQEINSQYDELLKHFTSNQTSSNNDYSTETELKNILNKVVQIKADIVIELIGTWIWISGNTYSYKKELKENGFKWASQKKQWYWHSEAFRKRSRKTLSMDDIKNYYGSTKVNTYSKVLLEA